MKTFKFPLSWAYVACSVHTRGGCTLIDVNVTVSTSVAGSTCTLVPIDQILRGREGRKGGGEEGRGGRQDGRREERRREEGRREEGKKGGREEGEGRKGGGRKGGREEG